MKSSELPTNSPSHLLALKTPKGSYALPVEWVHEVVRLPQNHKEYLLYHGKKIPIISFLQFLGVFGRLRYGIILQVQGKLLTLATSNLPTLLALDERCRKLQLLSPLPWVSEVWKTEEEELLVLNVESMFEEIEDG